MVSGMQHHLPLTLHCKNYTALKKLFVVFKIPRTLMNTAS